MGFLEHTSDSERKDECTMVYISYSIYFYIKMILNRATIQKKKKNSCWYFKTSFAQKFGKADSYFFCFCFSHINDVLKLSKYDISKEPSR